MTEVLSQSRDEQMDIDDDDDLDSVARTETQAECNARICATLAPYIYKYQSTLRQIVVNRARDVDMWHGFVNPGQYGYVQQVSVEHAMEYRLCDAQGMYTITPGSVQCKQGGLALPNNPPRHPDSGQVLSYSIDEVYPFNFSLRRWNNNSPLDLGVYVQGKPAGLEREELQRVMRNWKQHDAPFMIMKARSTQDDAQNTKGDAAIGLAYVGRDFGPVSENHLVTFAPLRRHHLRNGCIRIPDDVMQEAQLPFTRVDGANNIQCWYLLPYDSLLAWPIRELSYQDRLVIYGVMAIGPISAHDKRTDRTISTYFIITDRSLDLMVNELCAKVVDKVTPLRLSEIGVKLMPCECPGEPSWTDLTANHDVTPIMSAEERTAIMEARRSLYVRYYVKYAIFPTNFSSVPNLAPRIPDNWPPYSVFDKGTNPSIGSVKVNDQRVKK